MEDAMKVCLWVWLQEACAVGFKEETQNLSRDIYREKSVTGNLQVLGKDL